MNLKSVILQALASDACISQCISFLWCRSVSLICGEDSRKAMNWIKFYFFLHWTALYLPSSLWLVLVKDSSLSQGTIYSKSPCFASSCFWVICYAHCVLLSSNVLVSLRWWHHLLCCCWQDIFAWETLPVDAGRGTLSYLLKLWTWHMDGYGENLIFKLFVLKWSVALLSGSGLPWWVSCQGQNPIIRLTLLGQLSYNRL